MPQYHSPGLQVEMNTLIKIYKKAIKFWFAHTPSEKDKVFRLVRILLFLNKVDYYYNYYYYY